MYQVKVLSDKEFEELPYPDMETSLGVADPKTNTAYVRYTGVEGVDQYLINHELEHLIEGHGGEHSDHYRNGVYYKGFGDVMANVLPIAATFIPGIGPIAGPATGFATQGLRSKPKQSFGGGQEQPNVMQAQQAGSAMDSFKPQSPNIVSPSSNSGGFGQAPGTGAIGQLTGGRSPIERVRGFFSSRSPQGGF